MSNNFEFRVSSQDEGQRLDRFLVTKLCEYSRSQLSSFIEEGLVKVNSKIKKASYKISQGDKVELFLDSTADLSESEKRVELNSDPLSSDERDDQDDQDDWLESGLSPSEYPLDIVYEDSSILVVNKPAGMVVHPGVGTFGKITLVQAVRYYLLSSLQDKEGIKRFNQTPRCGLVHRLDQDTSGLIIFAKDTTTHNNLSMQFKNKTNLREYTALLNGYLASASVDIESYLVRSRFNRMAFRSLTEKELQNFFPMSEGLEESDRFIKTYRGEFKPRILIDNSGCKARYSSSHFKKKCSYDHKLTLVTVRLDTGRTHQIRVHARDLGASVVGDSLYQGSKKIPSIDPTVDTLLASCVSRQLLHAGILGIRHPQTDQKICFSVKLPDDFQKVLYILEKLEDN